MTDRDQLADLVSRTYNACIDRRPIRDPYAAIADAVVNAGWRPPARVITDPADLDALPDLSIVVIPNGLAVQRWTGDGQAVWIGASDSLVQLSSHRLISIWREVSLLHVPTEAATA